MPKSREETSTRIRKDAHKTSVDALKNQRVAVYCRTATASPDQVSSIELFIKHYEDFIKEHEGWTFVGIYVDEGVSGASAKDIPDLQRMLEDARNGMFDLIITRDISRFARNMPDSIEIARELKELTPTVGVYFAAENLYTLEDSEEHRMQLLVALGNAAEEESRWKSENMTLGHAPRLSQSYDRPQYMGTIRLANIDQGVEKCEKE